VSDVSQGPGWWQASDLKWYPPESAPGGVQPTPQGSGLGQKTLSRGSLAASARVPGMNRQLSAGAAWPIVMIVCGVVMIIGSVNEWVSVKLPPGLPAALARVESAGASGTSQGFGWIPLISGITLIVLSMGLIVSVGAFLRLLSLGAGAAAGSGLGVAIYFVDRIASSQVTVGWGLIAVLVTAIATLVGAGAVTLGAGD
jgi:hypothetical protein